MKRILGPLRLRVAPVPATVLASILLVCLISFTAPTQWVLAQTPAPGPPDFTTLGFSSVASANYTPGTATTVTAGPERVAVPAGLYHDPVKFELLDAPTATYASFVNGGTVLSAYAFRVTDTTTNQLVGSFASPVTYSFTGSAVTPQTVTYNVTPTTPPRVTPNSSAGTVTGHTLSHTFGAASVAWLTVNPPAGAATSAQATPPPAPPAAPPVARTAAAAPPPAPPAARPAATVAPARTVVPPAAPNTGVGPGPSRATRPATAINASSGVSAVQPGVAAAPGLPNTGTGGLLSKTTSPVTGEVGLIFDAVVGVLLLSGIVWLRRRPIV